VNRSIADWNQLPTGAIGTDHGNTYKFKTRVRKMLTGEANTGVKREGKIRGQ